MYLRIHSFQLHINQRLRHIFVVDVLSIIRLTVKFTLEHAIKVQKGSRGKVSYFFNLSVRRGWVVKATPRPLYSRERPGTPFYRRMGGSQGRSERVRKISAPPGFDPRTIQPVASRYTDYANFTTY